MISLVYTANPSLYELSLSDSAIVHRFRTWVNECSQLFGGLDIVAVQAIVGKDGREYIIEVCRRYNLIQSLFAASQL